MENITTTQHTHPTYIPLHLNYEKMKVTLTFVFFIFTKKKTFPFLFWEKICYVHVNSHYLIDNSGSL